MGFGKKLCPYEFCSRNGILVTYVCKRALQQPSFTLGNSEANITFLNHICFGKKDFFIQNLMGFFVYLFFSFIFM